MILIDTSVWADHFRARDQVLADLLQSRQVLVHSLVIGELGLGHLGERARTMAALGALPRATEATHGEVLNLIESERLIGVGIGLIDVHLLASSRLSGRARLWTRDRRLAVVAARLGIEWPTVD